MNNKDENLRIQTISQLLRAENIPYEIPRSFSELKVALRNCNGTKILLTVVDVSNAVISADQILLIVQTKKNVKFTYLVKELFIKRFDNDFDEILNSNKDVSAAFLSQFNRE